MERLSRIRRQRARSNNIKLALVGVAILLVAWLISARLHNENKGYKHGAYNYYMCVEQYGLNEDCQ